MKGRKVLKKGWKRDEERMKRERRRKEKGRKIQE